MSQPTHGGFRGGRSGAGNDHRLDHTGHPDPIRPRAAAIQHGYSGGVRIQRQVVDYALRRKSLLADVYAGRVDVAEVCDANPYLLRAAKFHGRGSEVTCPICRKEQLTLVSWVYGDGLGPIAGSARSPEELVRLAESREEFSVHVVEVCRTCSWNHLVQSYVLGKTPQRRSRSRVNRRTAAE